MQLLIVGRKGKKLIGQKRGGKRSSLQETETMIQTFALLNINPDSKEERGKKKLTNRKSGKIKERGKGNSASCSGGEISRC